MNFPSHLGAPVLFLALACCIASANEEQFSGLIDLDGKPVISLPANEKTPLVIVFMSVECPIANRYAPTLRKLAETNNQSRFVLVYPHADEGAARIRGHLREYELTLEAWRDTTKTLARSIGATITPEAAVFVRGAMVYRGRIDDRFATWGKQRPSPSKHDLQEVLSAIAAGEKFEKRITQPVGCYIGSVDE